MEKNELNRGTGKMYADCSVFRGKKKTQIFVHFLYQKVHSYKPCYPEKSYTRKGSGTMVNYLN